MVQHQTFHTNTCRIHENIFKQDIFWLSIYNAYIRQATKLCGHSRVKVTTRTNNSLYKLSTNDTGTPVCTNSPAQNAMYIQRTFKNKVTHSLMSECYCDSD